MNDWHLVRIKRRWVPEWLWRALGQSVLREPLRSATTREMTPEEAAQAWRQQET